MCPPISSSSSSSNLLRVMMMMMGGRENSFSRRMSEKGIWEIWPVTSPLESGAKTLGRGKRNWNRMGLTVHHICINLGKCSKTPITAICRDGGTPSPLPSSRQAAGQKINGKKITEKGGPPPPPSRRAAWNFFAENGVFFA